VKRVLRLILAVTILGSATVPAGSHEPQLKSRYFLVVWSYGGMGHMPRASHTFTTLYDGADLAVGRVAPATISWLSETTVFHLFGAHRGHNISLSQTLAMACQTGKRVVSFGPFEITRGLYRLGLARIKLLRSGRIAYNGSGLHSRGMNCIQAAGDLTNSSFHPGPVWGVAGSRSVVRHLSPFFQQGGRINEKVADMVLQHRCP